MLVILGRQVIKFGLHVGLDMVDFLQLVGVLKKNKERRKKKEERRKNKELEKNKKEKEQEQEVNHTVLALAARSAVK